ncbi:MAG: hypothetical protein K6A35_06405 [bacterium]|nr:hypothetical protein [bacterium]
MSITVTAPMRIDLAGGTLDLHPLYLFLERPLTVTASITICSQAKVTPIEGNRVRIISEDLNETLEAENTAELPLGGSLDLLVRAVKFYAPQGGLELRTRSQAPKGSGLGASSSLLMSMSRALGLFSEREDSIHDIIMYGASLEAQNLRIPTGYQDYYGACLGGVNGLEFKVDGHNIRTLYSSPDFFRQLTEFMIISFTGQSHFSGTSNWNMLKRYVDNEGDTVKRMEAIEDTAHQMWDALICEDMNRVAAALDREWQNRRGLAEGVTNERIDAMVLAAKNAGALASKICGAGGGGCMLTLCAPDKRAQVLEALRNRGAEILEATIDTEGMKVV